MSDIIQVPVAVHRWFAEGEGWAYYPKWEKKIEQLVQLLDPYLKSPDTKKDFQRSSSGRILIVQKLPDDECP
jgi:hypothetical protein